MNITDGNTTYGNLHVPFFWRVSNRTELNNILVDVRGEGVEGRGEGVEGGRWEGSFFFISLQVVKSYNVFASTSSFGSAQYNRWDHVTVCVCVCCGGVGPCDCVCVLWGGGTM